MNFPLTEDNFKTFAIESYNHSHCLGVDEFKTDFIKLLRINRSIEFYLNDPDKGIAVRLLLNTFISLLNVFDHKALVRMVCFKGKEEHMPVILSVFDFLQILPKSLPETDISKYKYDEDLLAKLEAL